MAYSDRIILQTPDVRVRQMCLAVNDEVPWHYHSHVMDTIYCLQGVMKVELKDPVEATVLRCGDGCDILVGRPHRISVLGEGPVSYLLIQGVGPYDFQQM